MAHKVVFGLWLGLIALPATADSPQFVPNVRAFWDASINWTTDYGPAYRDATLAPSNMVPCEGEFALCFSSGPEPLPCTLTDDGRSAECVCTALSGRSYVLINAI